jgi:hypothetical protein
VTIDAAENHSRLAVVHALAYSLGMILLITGLLAHAPYLLLIAGPCLSISGGLIWAGTHFTLTGPVGQILRPLLGRSRVATMHLRAALWVGVGILVTLWGALSLRAPKHDHMLPQDPTISDVASYDGASFASLGASSCERR